MWQDWFKKSQIKVSAWILMASVVLTQFTNCDVYSNNGVFSSASQYSCVGNDCKVSSSDLLEIGSPNELLLLSTDRSVDVGGNCNEGGFVANAITWVLSYNGAVISSCTSLGSCGECIKGRYQTTVNIGQVPITGMQVELEIRGISNQGIIYTGRPTLSKHISNIRVP